MRGQEKRKKKKKRGRGETRATELTDLVTKAGEASLEV